MASVDYFALIQKYISPESLTFRIYLPHAVLVTTKALKIGRRLDLGNDQLEFIKEASMLHDIGIVHVSAPEIGCTGTLGYLWHGPEGRRILEAEGLFRHALVCERHLGVGLSRKEIRVAGLDLPDRDMMPQSIEEQIICYADLFFSKTPSKLWSERTLDQVRNKVLKYGPHHRDRLERWIEKFDRVNL